MRIYTRVEFEWNEEKQQCVKISSESYEYSGSVAYCGGSKTPAPPPPTAQETAIQEEQLAMMREQRKETAELKPLLYRSAGLVQGERKWIEGTPATRRLVKGDLSNLLQTVGGRTPDAWEDVPATEGRWDEGGWREKTWEEQMAAMNPAEKQEYEYYQQLLERQKQALAGEIPISPGMEREIADYEGKMSESLSRRLGSGWASSTPGIQAQGKVRETAGMLREEARQGIITSGEGQLLARQIGMAESTRAGEAGRTGMYANIPGRTGGQMQGYGGMLQPYQYQRELQNQANMQNAANRAQNRAGMMQLGGSVAAAAVTYAAIAA